MKYFLLELEAHNKVKLVLYLTNSYSYTDGVPNEK